MFLVRTASGTEYVVRNGRLTRTSTQEPNPYLGPEYAIPAMVDAPFTNDTTPAVGERWRYRLVGQRGPYVTSPVVSVARYCAGCDTFGDLFLCGNAA
jgi:hypothetical protein